MRAFKLGLSKPKSKKNVKANASIKLTKISEINEIENTDSSGESSISISRKHLEKRSDATEGKNKLNEITTSNEDLSVTDLVKGFSQNTILKRTEEIAASALYDQQKEYEPVAGPSKMFNDRDCSFVDNSMSDFLESSPDVDKGITSFYDTSKIFNISMDVHGINTSIQDLPECKTGVKNEIINREWFRNCDMNVQETSGLNDCKDIVITPKIKPPTKSYIMSTCENYSIPKNCNPKPFYSNYKDVGDKVEIGQLVVKLQSKQACDQISFEKVVNTTSIEEWRQLLFLQQSNEMVDDMSKPEMLKSLLAGNKKYVLEPVKRPPTRSEVIEWLHKKEKPPQESDEFNVDCKELSKNLDELESSQVIGLNEDEINCSISLESTDKVSILFRYVNFNK